MSAIDRNTVQKLAHLSRLELSENQEEKMIGDLGAILDWVEQLDEVDTENVAPLASVNEEASVLRVDKAVNYFQNNEATKNAPEKEGDYFVVPKVLG
ncbi:Asp-tRNA(Asn)/Glu-tRNA(Gln) amidotransferase subunit GatC [Reichenbachiella ulvae]|uniref:Aspartyl/glutamyl-tRNA(Asn/Gln) amidotransferase subunit C n=1 Tax=Reichenbachiella ulvae TaxID=2980104 RepID=A0ABT3CYC1_9BACT|nr:Asp-tRNA(Asn)/Glu-tRNA(Gln) amidotransferase subunit GatC [Reichenbachiella ulvae]MCV9388692.1 Asp-tRNA(Asn)/Glu-tRNA(Gln) amidotransferase subunit GatC [Reichenbachiella ulvae]